MVEGGQIGSKMVRRAGLGLGIADGVGARVSIREVNVCKIR
jgi:hypothetical protein